MLGGIGSLPGAMLGGLLIGLIETFWSAYFSIEYKDVAAFAILALVLIFLPTGLLGRRRSRRSERWPHLRRMPRTRRPPDRRRPRRSSSSASAPSLGSRTG